MGEGIFAGRGEPRDANQVLLKVRLITAPALSPVVFREWHENASPTVMEQHALLAVIILTEVDLSRPRRFPSCHVDWQQRLLHMDSMYVVVDKPADLPCQVGDRVAGSSPCCCSTLD